MFGYKHPIIQIILFIILIIVGFILFNFLGHYIGLPCDVYCKESNTTLTSVKCHFGILDYFEYVDAPFKLACDKNIHSIFKYLPTLFFILLVIVLPFVILHIIQIKKLKRKD